MCRACVDIDAGRFVDYIEMDAASNRGVDEMAQLLEQAIYAPSNARFKVYMIDEVHMLTSHAFNAMLKTLEEPPEHVKFILATTDPQKIPVTVLSRCLQFNLKQMPVPDIVGHLAHVLAEEGIGFERGALQLLGRAAAGSMRDALSLTDQAIAYSAGQLGEATVRNMLGALDQTYLLRVLDALADADGPTLMTVVDEIASRSLSFGNALQELGAMLHRIASIQLIPSTDDAADADEAHLRVLAGRLSADDVQLYYQIAAHGRRDLSLAPDEITGFSMTLLRMLAFRIDDGSGAVRAPMPAPTRATPPVAAPRAAPGSASTTLPGPVSAAPSSMHVAPSVRRPMSRDVASRIVRTRSSPVRTGPTPGRCARRQPCDGSRNAARDRRLGRAGRQSEAVRNDVAARAAGRARRARRALGHVARADQVARQSRHARQIEARAVPAFRSTGRRHDRGRRGEGHDGRRGAQRRARRAPDRSAGDHRCRSVRAGRGPRLRWCPRRARVGQAGLNLPPHSL